MAPWSEKGSGQLEEEESEMGKCLKSYVYRVRVALRRCMAYEIEVRSSYLLRAVVLVERYNYRIV